MIASSDSILFTTTEDSAKKVKRQIQNMKFGQSGGYYRYDHSCKGIQRRMRIQIREKIERIAMLEAMLRELHA